MIWKLILFGGLVAQAYVEVENSYFESVEPYYAIQSQLTYKNWNSDITYPYEKEPDKGTMLGAYLYRTDIHLDPGRSQHLLGAILLGYKFSKKLYLDGGLGGSYLQNYEADLSESTPFILFNGKYILSKWYFGLSFKKAHSGFFVLPAGAIDSLKSHHFALNINWNLHERWKVKYLNQVDFYHDTNRKHEYDFSLMYGVSPGTPWIWVGLGANWLDYTQDIEGYWTPDRFLSMGTRLESSIPLFSKLTFFGAVNTNWIRENENAWGKGFYAASGLSFGERSAELLKLYIERIESVQGTNWWHSTTLFLNMSSHW